MTAYSCMRNPSQIQVDSNVTVEEVLVQLKNILENRYQMQLPEVSFFLRFLCTQTSIETIFSSHLPADRSANFLPTLLFLLLTLPLKIKPSSLNYFAYSLFSSGY